jgi:hypothetical protein
MPSSAGYSGNANLSYWNQLQASSAPGAALTYAAASPRRGFGHAGWGLHGPLSTRQPGRCPQSRLLP